MEIKGKYIAFLLTFIITFAIAFVIGLIGYTPYSDNTIFTSVTQTGNIITKINTVERIPLSAYNTSIYYLSSLLASIVISLFVSAIAYLIASDS